MERTTKVSDIADEYDIPLERLKAILEEMGLAARSGLSRLDDEQAALARARCERVKRKAAVDAERREALKAAKAVGTVPSFNDSVKAIVGTKPEILVCYGSPPGNPTELVLVLARERVERDFTRKFMTERDLASGIGGDIRAVIDRDVCVQVERDLPLGTLVGIAEPPNIIFERQHQGSQGDYAPDSRPLASEKFAASIRVRYEDAQRVWALHQSYRAHLDTIVRDAEKGQAITWITLGALKYYLIATIETLLSMCEPWLRWYDPDLWNGVDKPTTKDFISKLREHNVMESAGYQDIDMIIELRNQLAHADEVDQQRMLEVIRNYGAGIAKLETALVGKLGLRR